MPVHIFECFECGNREEKFVKTLENSICPLCGKESRIVFDWGKETNAFCDFKPFYDFNMDLTPTEITSRRQWAYECKKRNLVSEYLKNGYKNYHGEQKWI